MKKIFTFAAVLFAAMCMSAQTYDITTMNFVDADVTVENGTKTFNSEKNYFEIKNAAGETVKMTISQLPNMEFTYKNSAEKTAFKVTPEKNIQLDGDQRDLTINGLSVGTTITLWVASKGETAASFVDSETKGSAFTGCILVSTSLEGNGLTLPAKAKGEEAEIHTITLQAIASTATIRVTAGGYCLSKIQVGAASAVDNALVAPKAQKVIENGQILIVKDGVKYNVLGAIVAE